jgi:hypothetical protein
MEKDELNKTPSATNTYATADNGEGQVYLNKDEAHLASLGYKQGMRQPTGARSNGRAHMQQSSSDTSVSLSHGQQHSR